MLKVYRIPEKLAEIIGWVRVAGKELKSKIKGWHLLVRFILGLAARVYMTLKTVN